MYNVQCTRTIKIPALRTTTCLHDMKSHVEVPGTPETDLVFYNFVCMGLASGTAPPKCKRNQLLNAWLSTFGWP
jgi:hypothetical protein